MFCEAREKMRMRITLKKKSDPGQFAIPCTGKGIEFPHALCNTGASVSILPRVMADHLGLQVEPSQELFTFVDCSQKNFGGIVRDLEVHIGNALVPVDFYVLDIKLNWNSSLLHGRAFLSTVGAVCNLQTNQFCLTLIDPNAHYDPIPVKKLQAISRRINDPGIIAACHYGEDYEINYSASIETHTATSIDNGHQKSINISHDESVDSRPDDWESDYYNPIMAVNDATTEISDGLYDEELLNMQKRDGTDQVQAEVAWERTRTSHPIGRAIRPSIETLHQQSIDNNNSTSIDNRPIPNTTVSEKDKFDNQFLTPDEFGNGADNMFMHHRNNPGQKATKKFYDTAGGIDNSFIQKSRHPTQTSIDIAAPTSVARQPGFGRRAYDLYGNRKFYWEEKDEYGVYRDDRRYARDLDGNTIRLHNIDIRRLLERASRDEPNYICLPEHVNLFTQTKLVPEIYTKDEITEMFYEVCGEHKKNKEAF
ncbi:hypothetical protein F2Q68_00044343 [Brassica cretica]|uniref:Uncharacterized protein n=1 Tax=Brassica cretica TaxID=69181 RepID=A0A8S9LP91_BRACR|nr:hypothetical protein F2Q68_00044343 [Brassica cretica]